MPTGQRTLMTDRKGIRPMSTRDFRRSERRFVAALEQLGFGRLEFVRIHSGELALDPWPMTVQLLKFGAAKTNRTSNRQNSN